MREVTFGWKGQTITLVPSMALMQRIATEVRRVTEGSETTLSLAHKALHGGTEPMFMLVPLKAFIHEGWPQVATPAGLPLFPPSDDEIFAHMLESQQDVISFRKAYIQAILPHIDLGKDPVAPPPAGESKKAKKAGTSRK